MEFLSQFQEKYGNAVRFLRQVELLRHVWEGYHPPPPLKRGDMALLGMLTHMEEHGKGIAAGKLARLLRQTPSGISQKVGMLEQHGYLKRSIDEQDRRQINVELTDKGRSQADEALQSMLRQTEESLDTLGKENTDTLLELMQQLSDILEARHNNETEGEHAL